MTSVVQHRRGPKPTATMVRRGTPRPVGTTANNEWTEEIIGVLKEKHTAGWTYGEIEKHINRTYGTQFSRNAMIGKAKRIGLVDANPRNKSGPRVHTPKRPHLVGDRPAGYVRPRPVPPVFDGPPIGPEEFVPRYKGETAPNIPTELPTVEGGVPMLGAEGCRWPFGHDAQGVPMCCGKTRIPGSFVRPPMYCLEHAQASVDGVRTKANMEKQASRPPHLVKRPKGSLNRFG